MRVRHIGLVLAGMAVAWVMGSCSEGACTVGACSRGTSSFGACSRVEEARRVVAEADSLRVAGVTYSDSAAMAQTASSLEFVRAFYPTDYAHANYYLGRILRNSGDHPAAMEAFLRVTHSHTNDHTIKGRAYSNIGTMLNLAGEYALSYDMYEKCAEQFLQTGDSTLYFHALNAMAYQLTKQNLHNEALSVLQYIEHECDNPEVLTQIWETKAQMYILAQQYDSARYAVNTLYAKGYKEATGYVFMAQIYWYLEQYDSAMVYAQYVMSLPHASYRDRYNMLYILTYNDSTIDEQTLKERSELRADIDKEILDPLSKQLTQATALLKQDLNRKPNLGWLIGTLVTLLIISTIIGVYITRKREQHQLVSQKINDLQQKKESLSEQTQHLENVHSEYKERVIHDVEEFCQRIKAETNPQAAISWNDYRQMCKVVNKNIFGLADKLEDLGLADHEVKFCVLVLLKFSRKDCADWMSLGVSYMGRKKNDIALKLGTTSAHLYDFLLSLTLK